MLSNVCPTWCCPLGRVSDEAIPLTTKNQHINTIKHDPTNLEKGAVEVNDPSSPLCGKTICQCTTAAWAAVAIVGTVGVLATGIGSVAAMNAPYSYLILPIGFGVFGVPALVGYYKVAKK
jgi:hypothetical protein